MKSFSGIPVSSGTGIGPAFLITKNTLHIECRTVSETEKTDDWEKFQDARHKAVEDLSATLNTASKEQSEIFQTHLMMLSDEEFVKEVKTAYDSASFNIEHVLNSKVNEFADRLRQSGNDFLMDRANDIIDAYEKVFQILSGTHDNPFSNIPENAVVISRTLNPSDALLLSEKGISAIVTAEGGKNSHLGILARTYGIPYVSGISEEFFSTLEKDYSAASESSSSTISSPNIPLIVDGQNGIVILSPEESVLQEYEKKALAEKKQKELLLKYKDKPASTKDGVQLQILANISSPEEAELAEKLGADGVGLFRTEFFFMNRSDLSEEEQYRAYRKTLESLKGKPVTIRTLDAGGDKVINAEGFISAPEKNPLLGCRAIRFCLDNKDIFRTQLRALLRAGTAGNLNIMVPMISTEDELTAVKEIIQQAADDLARENIAFSRDIPTGIMVETPAAAMTAQELAALSTFFSIGTNDLTQYTMCIDRENAKVASLYREFHPAVIRLIRQTADAARKADIPVSVCGELAAKPAGAFLLFGLGIRKLSVSPGAINTLKAMFALFTEKEIVEITEKAVAFKNACKTEEYITNVIKERM